MTNLYLYQQSTPEDKCAAYASIYIYMKRNNIPVNESSVTDFVMTVNNEAIIDTQLATEVTFTMHTISSNLYVSHKELSAEKIGGELYNKIMSNPELTRDCGIALTKFVQR